MVIIKLVILDFGRLKIGREMIWGLLGGRLHIWKIEFVRGMIIRVVLHSIAEGRNYIIII